jgi:catalase
MNAEERARLYMNTAQAMQGVPQAIVDRALSHYDKVAIAYGDGIRAALAKLAGA